MTKTNETIPSSRVVECNLRRALDVIGDDDKRHDISTETLILAEFAPGEAWGDGIAVLVDANDNTKHVRFNVRRSELKMMQH